MAQSSEAVASEAIVAGEVSVAVTNEPASRVEADNRTSTTTTEAAEVAEADVSAAGGTTTSRSAIVMRQSTFVQIGL